MREKVFVLCQIKEIAFLSASYTRLHVLQARSLSILVILQACYVVHAPSLDIS